MQMRVKTHMASMALNHDLAHNALSGCSYSIIFAEIAFLAGLSEKKCASNEFSQPACCFSTKSPVKRFRCRKRCKDAALVPAGFDAVVPPVACCPQERTGVAHINAAGLVTRTRAASGPHVRRQAVTPRKPWSPGARGAHRTTLAILGCRSAPLSRHHAESPRMATAENNNHTSSQRVGRERVKGGIARWVANDPIRRSVSSSGVIPGGPGNASVKTFDPLHFHRRRVGKSPTPFFSPSAHDKPFPGKACNHGAPLQPINVLDSSFPCRRSGPAAARGRTADAAEIQQPQWSKPPC